MFQQRENGKRPLPPAEVKGLILTLLSAAALTAALVCLICDYFASEGLSWSWIVTASLAAAWLLFLPCLTTGKHILRKTLVMASILPFPLLALLAFLLETPVVFTLGACVSLIVIAGAWAIYGIFRRCRGRLWRAAGFALLVLIPAPIAITHTVARFLTPVRTDLASDLFHSGISLVLSSICFCLDCLTHHQGGAENP